MESESRAGIKSPSCRRSPHIKEYRCHQRQCPACATTTMASLPDALASQFGPQLVGAHGIPPILGPAFRNTRFQMTADTQLTALIAYLTVVCRLPKGVGRGERGGGGDPMRNCSMRFLGEPRTRGAPLPRDQLIARVPPIEKRFVALAEMPRQRGGREGVESLAGSRKTRSTAEL